MSWLYRGAQSALFYYASCTPIHRRKHIRRRAQQNKRDRAAREEYEATLPPHMVYQQPEPLKTNKHWDEEIAAGPTPSTNKRAVKTQDTASKRLRRAQESRRNQPIEVPEILVDEADDHSQSDQPRRVEADGRLSNADASMTTSLRSPSPSRPASRNHHRKWYNHKRWYQRQDEELGTVQRTDTDESLLHGSLPTSSTVPNISDSRHSARLFAEPDGASSILSPPPATASRETYETTVRINNVNNDQTPLAIPARFLKSASSQWMFQTLPAPSFMSGKDPESRSRSSTLSSKASTAAIGRNSAGSLRKDHKAQDLRRQLSARALEDKLKHVSHHGRGGEVLPNVAQKDMAPDATIDTSHISVSSRGAEADGEEADDEDQDARYKAEEDERTYSKSGSRRRQDTSSSSNDTPISSSTIPPKPPPAAFDPSKTRPPRGWHMSSHGSAEGNDQTSTPSRQSNHRKRMTPDTASFLFSYPVPLPEAFKEDPDVAREARLSWERRMRGKDGGEGQWREPGWERYADEGDDHGFYDGPNDSVLIEEPARAETGVDRRWSARTF